MIDSNNNLLGKRIKELRKHKGLTQEILAERVNVDSKHLSRIESGKNLPSLILLQKISAQLDIPLEKFFKTEHLRSRQELILDINKKLELCDDKKIKMIFKLVDDIDE